MTTLNFASESEERDALTRYFSLPDSTRTLIESYIEQQKVYAANLAKGMTSGDGTMALDDYRSRRGRDMENDFFIKPH
jgi:hypothetical protein